MIKLIKIAFKSPRPILCCNLADCAGCQSACDFAHAPTGLFGNAEPCLPSFDSRFRLEVAVGLGCLFAGRIVG